MKIYVASDHAGFELRHKLMARLRQHGHDVRDLGPATAEPTDYPDHAADVGRAVRGDAGTRGLLVCGSGLGICMAANKIRGVRAVAPWNVEAARWGRAHNDSNVLCIGARLVPEADAEAMVDAWLATDFEGGRHARRVGKMSAIEASEGAAFAVETERRVLEARRVVPRIWDKDPEAFTRDPAHAASIRNRLGWLRSPDQMAGECEALAGFAAEIRQAGFTHAVLLGMGGSSLCPEVLVETFGAAPGMPRLIVLDNTDPAAVAGVEKRIDLDRTLFVVASKSGGTIEIRAFESHFWNLVLARQGGSVERTGRQFVAITDPGTALDAQAARKQYRRVFRNPADIGGRYSALSYFGLVPAALLGIDIVTMVERARRMADRCRSADVAGNPGAALGAALGALAKQGRDKLTLLLAPEIAAFGAWIEQLVAESTGKLGRGIVPVDGEAAGAAEAYASDRVFVSVSLAGGGPAEPAATLSALRAAGHPVFDIVLPDRLELGAEFFRWEMATAVAGASLDINPFDEPNVAEAKDATGRCLEAYGRDGHLPAVAESGPDDRPALAQLLGTVAPGDYLAVCAFFERTAERDRHLGALRAASRNRLRVATTLGYGPRFLHSTGQLHKGGAGSGVFLQLVSGAARDLAIPGESFTFGVLRDAQALGDFEVLARRGRRVLRVRLGPDIDGDLARLVASAQAALGTRAPSPGAPE